MAVLGSVANFHHIVLLTTISVEKNCLLLESHGTPYVLSFPFLGCIKQFSVSALRNSTVVFCSSLHHMSALVTPDSAEDVFLGLWGGLLYWSQTGNGS